MGQECCDAEKQGDRTADQHPDARHRVDGALGDGTQSSALHVPTALRYRVDAIDDADQPQKDDQDPSRQRHGSLRPDAKGFVAAVANP